MPLSAVPRPQVQSGGSEVVDLAPPEYLTDDEKVYWQMWAPAAIRRGMLTEDTRYGFAELCQAGKRKASLWAEIEGRGFVHEIVLVDGSGQERHELKKHPLMTEWRGLVKQVELLMARFGLTGDGKLPEQQPTADEEETALADLLRVK